MILSLFAGCGGLDLGFEQAGFKTGLAYDIRPYSVSSWNQNRPDNPVGRAADINQLTLAALDEHFGGPFKPTGVIGGPPCQSFSRGNSSKSENDPREKLVARYFSICLKLHRRSPLDFIMMENVQELASATYENILNAQIEKLKRAKFSVHFEVLDAADFGVPQFRKRLILVAFNKVKFSNLVWSAPTGTQENRMTVKDAIGGLKHPVFFSREIVPSEIPVHPNHWCMMPRSNKFFNGTLKQGEKFGRSFKTLEWSRPSNTVSYGHREVHVHPSGKRRLSIYEAMLLQGFPKSFVLNGNLSQQVTQVSEAVPPPLAFMIAKSIREQIKGSSSSQTASEEIAEAA